MCVYFVSRTDSAHTVRRGQWDFLVERTDCLRVPWQIPPFPTIRMDSSKFDELVGRLGKSASLADLHPCNWLHRLSTLQTRYCIQNSLMWTPFNTEQFIVRHKIRGRKNVSLWGNVRWTSVLSPPPGSVDLHTSSYTFMWVPLGV